MPLISWDQANAGSDVIPGQVPEIQPPDDIHQPSVLDVAAGALRRNNLVTNVFDLATRKPNKPSQGYNPFTGDELSGFEDYADRFVRSRSPEETMAIKGRIGQEQRDQGAIAQAGGWGFAASIAAGLIDPVTLMSMAIPVAAPVTWGSRFARVAAGVGAQGAVDTASEAVFHQSQETRTIGESVANVAAGALLTGAFGAIATRVPKSEFEGLRKKLQTNLDTLPPVASTAGAAAVASTTLADETIAKGGGFLARTAGRISPLTRILQSPLLPARQLVQRLGEVPFMLQKNLSGVATADSVETAVKRRVSTSLKQNIDNYESSFREYSARAGQGSMSLPEFGEAVSAAMRRGDKSDIPEVEQLAKATRKLFNDDLAELKSLGLVGDDFELLGAESYFPRVYDHHAIAANRLDFEERLRKWYTDNPRKQFPNDEAVSSIEGGPTDAARFFSEEADSLVDAHSVVLRDNRGTEIGRMVMKERGDSVQILRTQVASDWRRKGFGKRMITEALEHAKGLGKSLQSDSVVTVDQLRAYESLRRDGFLVEYADEAEVQNFLKTAKDGEELVGAGPVVKRVDAPETVLKSLEIQRTAAREALAAAKAEHTTKKAVKKVDRLGMNRARRAVERVKDKLEDLQFRATVAPSDKLTDTIANTEARLARAEEKVAQKYPQFLEDEAALEGAKKVRGGAGNALRAIERDIRKTKANVAAAKRAAEHAKSIKAKSELPDWREPAEIDTAVKETLDRILGTVRGMADLGHNANPSPLKHRALDMPDDVLEPYLVSDFDRVMSGYIRTMAPQLEMRKTFGSTTLQTQIDQIVDHSRVLINKLSSNPEKEKLRKETARTIADLTHIRDRILGQVGPRGDQNLALVQAARLIRSYNYVRLLGSQTLSSLSDLGHVMSRYGLARTGVHLAKFLTSIKANKLTRMDAQRMGTALDWTLDTRTATLQDIGDELAGSKLEKFAQWGSNKFTRLTGMATWNSSLKAITSALEQDALIRATRKSTLSAFEKGKFAQMGIGDEQMARVAEQLKKYGDDSDGLFRARTDLWDDKEAAKLVEDAVVKAADLMVITRGAGDLPIFMDSEMAKTLMQFKSFGMAAVNRIMIPMAQGVAHGDVASANGLAAMLALGALTYYVKELAAGREPDLSPERIIPEALNWSGALAFLPDIYDPAAGLVHAPRLSRYTNRTPIETLLGPTLGTATEAYQTAAGITDLGITQKDLHRLRQMTPMQNLFYLRRIINALEGEAGEAINAEGSNRKTFVERVTEEEKPE